MELAVRPECDENHNHLVLLSHERCRTILFRIGCRWRALLRGLSSAARARKRVRFGAEGHVEAARELLALRIIEIAQLSERDSARLRDNALAYLTRTNLRSTGL